MYEPGAGCLGIPRKIQQGFSQEDLQFVTPNCSQHVTEDVTDEVTKPGKLLTRNIHRLVPKVGVSSSLRFEHFHV